MKRLILLPTLLIIFQLNAQTFKMLDASKTDVSNGQAVVTGDINTIIKSQFYIVNTTSTAASFKAKKIELNIQSGTVNTFCFNDQCYPPHIFESTSALMVQPGDTTSSSGFYGEYTPGDITGTTVITYVVFNSSDPNDSTHVTVSYNVAPESVNKIDFSNVEFSNPYPNPVNVYTRINYNIPHMYVSAKLIIRNIIGTTVKEFEIPSPQGKLNLDLSDLNEGIYFYSLIIDENVILTRKLIKN